MLSVLINDLRKDLTFLAIGWDGWGFDVWYGSVFLRGGGFYYVRGLDVLFVDFAVV